MYVFKTLALVVVPAGFQNFNVRIKLRMFGTIYQFDMRISYAESVAFSNLHTYELNLELVFEGKLLLGLENVAFVQAEVFVAAASCHVGDDESGSGEQPVDHDHAFGLYVLQ
jgi:hypothetical protein